MCSKQLVQPFHPKFFSVRRQTIRSEVSQNPSAFLVHHQHCSNRSQLLSSSIRSIQDEPRRDHKSGKDLLERRFIRNMSKLKVKKGRNQTKKYLSSASANEIPQINTNGDLVPTQGKTTNSTKQATKESRVVSIRQCQTLKRKSPTRHFSNMKEREDRKTIKEQQLQLRVQSEKLMMNSKARRSISHRNHFRQVRNSETGVKFEFELDYDQASDFDIEALLPEFDSESLTDVPSNVVPLYSYQVSHSDLQSRKDIGKCVTRLRDMDNYKKCIILPDDPWKVKWNIFLIMQARLKLSVILFSSFMTPLRAAFVDEDELEWVLTQTFIDLVFLFDLIFTFFSAYYNKIEMLITSRRQITCNYLKTWFIVDLLSILPLSLMFRRTNDLGKLAKLPRIYQIIKTTKFARLLKAVKTKSRIRKKMGWVSSTNIEVDQLLSLLFVFAVLCHTLSCIWFLLAKLQDFNETTWVASYDYLDAPQVEQYLAGLYFIVTTISTVGYGDITSQNPIEQLFCLPLMIVGVIGYSVAISSITGVMDASARRRKRLNSKLNVLEDLREEYSLPFKFYWKLRQSLHYDHIMDKTEHQNFIQELPVNIGLELSNIMYTHQLRGIEFFENKRAEFIAALAPKLKPVKVCKGEYIFLKGDSLDGIYFIKKGEAAFVERRHRADLIFGKLREGTHFGDIDFTNLSEGDNPSRHFTVKAMTEMDLLLLEKEDLYAVDNCFKKEVFSLFQYSNQHLQKLKGMSRKGEGWLHKRYMTANQITEHSPGYSEEVDQTQHELTAPDEKQRKSRLISLEKSPTEEHYLTKELIRKEESFRVKQDLRNERRISRQLKIREDTQTVVETEVSVEGQERCLKSPVSLIPEEKNESGSRRVIETMSDDEGSLSSFRYMVRKDRGVRCNGRVMRNLEDQFS